ncbi:MAG: cell wall metabolism sensor histidine kinase WalK [Lactobacillus sp.]|nr:cell wall metabolism sensor histidine kinase WalK [Lactobacillus sp.]MDN6052441.1 cell wall metabolism sensor histidine kinase WalK [Lactobacillus sp.]
MKKIITKLRAVFNSINTKLAIVFMLMLLATIEIIGAYFTRQLDQTSIENFQTSIQVPTIVTNQLANQLVRDTKNADARLGQIVSDYNNSSVSDFIVVDNKDIIREVSNLNDKDRIGQRINDADVKQVTSTGRQVTRVMQDRGGNFMIQITPLTSGSGSGTTVGAIYVKASMQSVFSGLRNTSISFLVASLVAAVMGAVLSLVISRAITRPIEEMQFQALHITDGDYSNQVRIYSNDELGQLGRAFNTLAVRIELSQEESESERRRLDSVLSHMTDGVLATDRHGNVTVVNQMAVRFLNVQEGEIMGRPIAEVMAQKETSSPDLIASQRDIDITVNENTPDEMILRATFSLIKRVTGFVSGSVCVLHDITEQTKNENSQRQFVSNVSHELRTPLTSMSAYIDALIEGAWKDSKIAPKFLEVTQEETNRMIRMINDLLSLSRIDRGVSKMSLELVNLNDFLAHVLDRFDMIVKSDAKKENKKKYQLKRDLGTQALWVEIDTDKMMQVIDNIINNAIKYSPDGGLITVRLVQNQNRVVLSISDQGLGIPRKDLDKIFDRFYRVDKARSRAQGGTGLGLAIAKEIIEAHQGRLWADSSEGKGSTFFISLPYEPMTEEADWDEV